MRRLTNANLLYFLEQINENAEQPTNSWEKPSDAFEIPSHGNFENVEMNFDQEQIDENLNLSFSDQDTILILSDQSIDAIATLTSHTSGEERKNALKIISNEMKNCSGMDKLRKYEEKVRPGLMSYKKIHQSLENDDNLYYEDPVAQSLLDKYYPDLGMLAIAVPGAGNCAFMSFAKQLTHSIYNYDEIKLSTACTMITDKPKVMELVKKHHAHDVMGEDWGEMDLNYMEEIKYCLTDGKHAGVYQIAAASIACKAKFNLLYPPVMGQSDQILGGIFCDPELDDGNMKQYDFIWSECGSYDYLNPNHHFRPNHIVPLFKIAEDAEDQSSTAKNSENNLEGNINDSNENDEPAQASENVDENEKNGDIDNIQEPTLKVNLRFMNTAAVFQEVKDFPQTEILDSIPKGNKTNKKYIVSSQDNVSKYLNGEDMDHWNDDKGKLS